MSKMEGKTNSSRHLQAVRNRDCLTFGARTVNKFVCVGAGGDIYVSFKLTYVVRIVFLN